MASTAGHIRKRQYQPPITRFFNDGRQGGISALSPSLPEETQASLLTVGMRVRKSVPEGYKTHKTQKTNDIAALPFSSSAPQPSRLVSQAATGRELMPFCGLFKTGGMAAQEIPVSSAPTLGSYDTADEESSGAWPIPVLSMSQGTLPSSQGSFDSLQPQVLTSRKRTYQDEMEAGIDAFFDEMQAEDEPLPHQPKPVRRLAKMRSSMKSSKRLEGAQGAHGDDFEEAAFLAPMDMDYQN